VKIQFDHQIFTHQSYGGISRYYVELASLMLSRGQDVFISAGIHRNHYLSSRLKGHVIGRYAQSFPRKTWRFLLDLNSAVSEFASKRKKPDIFHETYYSAKTVQASSAIRILTVYDMNHELYRGIYYSSKDRTAEYKSAAVKRADHIICISKSTQKDLLRLLDVPEEKTSVVYLGVDENKFDNSVVLSDYIEQSNPYFLYVGGRGGAKNFSRLAQAYCINEIASKADLVLFGGGALRKGELQFFKKMKCLDKVKQIDGDDSLLAALYRNAVAFVYPSEYEGFGLPILEAMAAGCVVLSSHTSSLREVGGEACTYFDPHDVFEIRGALTGILSKKTDADWLMRAGKERVKQFSWDKCAARTAELYERLLSDR